MGYYIYVTPCCSKEELGLVTGFLEEAIKAGVCFSYRLIKITKGRSPFRRGEVCVIWDTDSKNDTKGIPSYRARYKSWNLERLLDEESSDFFDPHSGKSPYGKEITGNSSVDFKHLSTAFLLDNKLKYIYQLEDLYIDFDWRKYKKHVDLVLWEEELEEFDGIDENRAASFTVNFKDRNTLYHATSLGPGLFRIHPGEYASKKKKDTSTVLGYLSAHDFCSYFDAAPSSFSEYLKKFGVQAIDGLKSAIEQFRSDQSFGLNCVDENELEIDKDLFAEFYLPDVELDRLAAIFYTLTKQGYKYLVLINDWVTAWFHTEEEADRYIFKADVGSVKDQYISSVQPIEHLCDVHIKRSASALLFANKHTVKVSFEDTNRNLLAPSKDFNFSELDKISINDIIEGKVFPRISNKKSYKYYKVILKQYKIIEDEPEWVVIVQPIGTAKSASRRKKK